MHKNAVAVFIAIVLVAGIRALNADMVILKTGEMFETQRAWKENGVVKYYENGRVVRVDEHEVERLILSPAPSEDLPPPSPGDDDIGYRDLKWGQSLSQVEGLTPVGTDPAYGGVQQYINPQRTNRFGRASVDNIVYGFWQGELYTIMVQISNFLDFRDLKEEAFRRFDKGIQNRGDVEKYFWIDKESERLLSYDYDSDTGFLWMRSRAVHEKVRAHYPD